jgi:hypothetical protein
MADDLGSLVVRLAADLADLKAGLLSGKGELSAFKDQVATTVSEVKGLLRFAGISLGLYELIAQAREFGRAILEEGGKVEVLKAAAQSLAAYYGMSAESVDLYVKKLQEKNLTEEQSLRAVNDFLKAGVSLEKLPQLADAAKGLAASMGMPFQEAFDEIIKAITKGMPRQLSEMVPGLRSVMEGMSTESKRIMDSTVISGAEKANIMAEAVLAFFAKLKGASGELEAAYHTQMTDYLAKIAEVKEALFEFVKPVAVAITKEEIKSWDDFYHAVGNSRQGLQQLGEAAAVWVGHIGETIRWVASFIIQHKELFLILVEIKGTLLVMKWTGIEAGIAAISRVLVQLGLLRAALSGPWALVIAVSFVGLHEGLKAVGEAVKKQPSLTEDMLTGEAWGVASQEGESRKFMGSSEQFARNKRQQAEDKAAAEAREFADRLAKANEAIAAMTPAERTRKGPATTGEEAGRQADEAAKKRQEEARKQLGDVSKAGKAGTEYDLWSEYYTMMEQKRQFDLQMAANEIELAKATGEAKKAELQKELAEGTIDGQTYYAKLQEMQKAETDNALLLIEKKREAQEAAYKTAKAQLAAEELPPQTRAYREYSEYLKNQMEMKKLDAEAAKAKLEGEAKVTEELKRQVEVRQQYQQKTEDLNLETAQLLGHISEQEATLQKLYLDWQRAKQEAIKAGAPQEYFTALQASYQAKTQDQTYGQKIGSVIESFTSGFDSLVKALMDGKTKIGQALEKMGDDIIQKTLKLFTQDLSQAITQGLKNLLNNVIQSLGLGAGGGGFGGMGMEEEVGMGGMEALAAFILGRGGVIDQGRVLAMAKGAIVSSRVIFPMASGMGLMGESGPEAVMPLERISGGNLGIRALLPPPGPTQVTVINNTGVQAQVTAQQKGDGTLELVLERAISKMVVQGGDLQQALGSVFDINKRF